MSLPSASATWLLDGFEAVIYPKHKKTKSINSSLKPEPKLYSRPRRWARQGKGCPRSDELRLKARKGGLADCEGNSFLALEVGLLPPFAPGLPFELLNMIHPEVMSKPPDGTYQKAAILSRTASGYTSLVTGAKEIDTLLCLNKFYNSFLGAYLEEFVPMHLTLKATTLRHLAVKDTYDFEIMAMNKVLPATSRGLYLQVNCIATATVVNDVPPKAEPVLLTDEDPTEPLTNHAVQSADYEHAHEQGKEENLDLGRFIQDCATQWLDSPYGFTRYYITTEEAKSEEDFSCYMANQPAFDNLIAALRASAFTEDVVIDINIASDEFSVDEQNPESRPHNPVFDALVTAVEAMPEVKRYSVKLGRFGAFGSRENRMSWSNVGVFRVNHQAAFWQYGEAYIKLLRDLHVS